MSDDYTPTTEEIRDYVEVGGEPRPWMPPEDEKDAARAAAFDRWLAAHDAEVSEKARRDAIEEAVEATRNGPGWYRDDAERSVRRLIAVPTPPDAAEKTQ